MEEITSPLGERDKENVKQEQAALAEEAYRLATTVARRRADIALKRAEAATFAVSLESAKEQLDDALRDEAILRAQGPSSPKSNNMSPSFPDRSLILALQGQIDVTKASIEEAKQKKESLRKEIENINESRKNIERDGFGSKRSSLSPIHVVKRENSIEINPVVQVGSNRKNNFSEGKASIDNMELKLPPPAQQETTDFLRHDDLMKSLQEGNECDSTFRSDHARIWRDVTMPNLALVRKDEDEKPTGETSLGVVVERVFEGINCFLTTKTESNSAGLDGNDKKTSSFSPKITPAHEEKLEQTGEARQTNDSVAQLVMKKFGALTAHIGVDGFPAKIIAPTVALDRFSQLLRGTDMSPAPTPKHESPTLKNAISTIDSLNLNKEKCSETDSKPVKSNVSSPVRVKNEMLEHMLERMSQPSDILKPEHFAEIILNGVPIRFRQSAVNLIYSTNYHGMSLHTLYHRTKKTNPTIIAIKDTKGRVFGCYGSQIWKSSAVRYYGSGECFVFGIDQVSNSVQIFKWTRENSLFQFTSGTFLAVGGGAGSHFALWIDEDLLMGTTSECATFGNSPLTDINQNEGIVSTEFKILALEVWGFAPHRTR